MVIQERNLFYSKDCQNYHKIKDSDSYEKRMNEIEALFYILTRASYELG